MAVAAVDICNQALSHLGNSVEITNLDTDRSKEGQACRRFYESSRDKVLEDFSWPFARRVLALQLVAEDPNDEWGYSYRLPAGCLTPRRILSGQRIDTDASRVPFAIAGDETAALLYTDKQDAVLEYTALVTDASRFSAAFAGALALLLAGVIGPRVAGGDQFKLADRALQLYRVALAEAERNALAGEQPDSPPESSFILARD